MTNKEIKNNSSKSILFCLILFYVANFPNKTNANDTFTDFLWQEPLSSINQELLDDVLIYQLDSDLTITLTDISSDRNLSNLGVKETFSFRQVWGQDNRFSPALSGVGAESPTTEINTTVRVRFSRPIDYPAFSVFSLSESTLDTSIARVTFLGTNRGLSTVNLYDAVSVCPYKTSEGGSSLNGIRWFEGCEADLWGRINAKDVSYFDVQIKGREPYVGYASLWVGLAPASISGHIFLDSGSGDAIAHDGQINGSEAGLGGVNLKLLDNSGGNCSASAPVLAKTITNGDGSWQLEMSVDHAGTPACLVAETPSGLRPVSELAGTAGAAITLGASDDARMSLTVPKPGTVWEGINFGKVALPQLVPDQQGTVAPGSGIDYAHQFTAGTAGIVDFTLVNPTSTPATPAWNQTVLRDPSCDGNPDSALPVVGVPVVAGQQVCLVVRVNAPANTPVGAQHRVDLVANQQLANILLEDTVQVTDMTLVQDAQLRLEKRVQNLGPNGDGSIGNYLDMEFSTRNEGEPCDVLRYDILYTNMGTTPVTAFSVTDATPAFTFLTAPAACPNNLPDSLTGCNLLTPEGNNAQGYEGSLQWQFTGHLAPGSQGSVSYDVRIFGPTSSLDSNCK
ncbi:hypothetical protein [Vibrio sp. ArtGut-C1]|uniref:hypothetical protein n=1 Tax=Vibrio sp. ArtGut-C1 TaxID=2259137 RepID=UPI000A19B36B|nr:hypothetical protein [Vibrio sp. ArtGut-C1]